MKITIKNIILFSISLIISHCTTPQPEEAAPSTIKKIIRVSPSVATQLLSSQIKVIGTNGGGGNPILVINCIPTSVIEGLNLPEGDISELSNVEIPIFRYGDPRRRDVVGALEVKGWSGQLSKTSQVTALAECGPGNSSSGNGTHFPEIKNCAAGTSPSTTSSCACPAGCFSFSNTAYPGPQCACPANRPPNPDCPQEPAYDMVSCSNDPCGANEPLGPHGCGGCFSAGTKIRMGNQTEKNIEQIRTGEMVWNPILNKAFPVSKRTLGPEDKELIEIKIGDKNLRLTPTHPVMTKNGIKKTKDLKLTDLLQDKTGKFLPILSFQTVRLVKTEQVFNLEINPNSKQFKDHMIESNGFITGDLWIQNELQATARKKSELP